VAVETHSADLVVDPRIEVLAAVAPESVVGSAGADGLGDADDVQETMRRDAVHLDRSSPLGKTDAASGIREARAAVEADGVVGEKSVDPVIGHEPHFLEAVVEIRSQFPDAEIEKMLRTKRRDDVEPGV